VIHNPVASGADVDRLTPVAAGALDYVAESVRRARAGLRVPLIGFAGAPFTLASYLIEGGGSRTFLKTKRFMLDDAGAWHALMERLAVAVRDYLNLQIAGRRAGRAALRQLGRRALARRLPALRAAAHARAHRRRHAGHTRDPLRHRTAALLECQRAAGGDVIGVDWRVDLDAAWARVGHDVAVQGNLDPTVLLGRFPRSAAASRRSSARPPAARPRLQPRTRHPARDAVAHAKALVEMVHELSTAR
jgi:uroporphyrinogen decarboxylase